MKRNMSISFEEEIYDKLREMRNSSDFVNELVKNNIDLADKKDNQCAYCDTITEDLIWLLPDERLVCQACEVSRVEGHKSNILRQ